MSREFFKFFMVSEMRNSEHIFLLKEIIDTKT
jgi:hypothetical protein